MEILALPFIFVRMCQTCGTFVLSGLTTALAFDSISSLTVGRKPCEEFFQKNVWHYFGESPELKNKKLLDQMLEKNNEILNKNNEIFKLKEENLKLQKGIMEKEKKFLNK